MRVQSLGTGCLAAALWAAGLRADEFAKFVPSGGAAPNSAPVRRAALFQRAAPPGVATPPAALTSIPNSAAPASPFRGLPAPAVGNEVIRTAEPPALAAVGKSVLKEKPYGY